MSRIIRHALVTGADGFIGSQLVDLLLAQGIKVRALSQYNSFNNWGWLEGNSHPNLEVVCGDVRDAAFCRHITQGVDTVFHLAALIAIPYSYVAPESYVDTNITGTLNICQAAKDTPSVTRLLVTSTSEVYGSAQYVPIDESHPRQPQSPYSATKIGADAIAQSFYNAFGLPVVTVRPFNTYGPRQSARAIIPTIITQIANGAREIKVGDLTPTRDFNFVEDTCRGFLAIATADAAVEGTEINIATGTEVTMKETLELIADIMEAPVEYVVDPERLRPSKSEVRRLCGDNTRIRTLTGWEPQVTLRQGLARTIEWFSDPANLARYKANIYNR
ncbi:MAG: SDR family NAD(P)-dependent oxidoreductase [Muribaculaceae bacterium]|nr:SDR family NAD(P)-dependent oxidoreductase [Muribaculaceae bacterium]